MMAERIIQMIGFLFLNINNRISKQNNVCIAHMALYVRIFQQFNSNAIQVAYRIFLYIKILVSEQGNTVCEKTVELSQIVDYEERQKGLS